MPIAYGFTVQNSKGPGRKSYKKRKAQLLDVTNALFNKGKKDATKERPVK